MNTRKLLIYGVTIGVVTNALLTKHRRNQTEAQAGKFDEQPTLTLEDIQALDLGEPLPMFYEGDTVNIFTPYGEGIVIHEGKFAPEDYEVAEVKYDETDGVFRYKLLGKSGWHAEDWLTLPMYSVFVKEELTDQDEEVEAVAEPDKIAEFLRQTSINYHLDVMRHGSAEERAESERRLAELTGVDES